MKTAAAALLLLCTGCLLAPPSDADTDDRALGQAAQGIEPASGGSHLSSHATPSLVSALDELPRWRVFLRGSDGSRFDHPALIDSIGQVVAVREGEGADSSRWITLRLGHHWMLGDRYLDELRASGSVSATDLLVIASELLAHGGSLPALPAQPGKLRALGCIECGGGSTYNPLPGILGDDHTGDPPGGQVERPRPSHAGERAPSTRPIVRHPRLTPPPPAPEALGALKAYHNGVREGDPEPVPFPMDATYHPGQFEGKEAFKCEGRVYRGYKRACIDFQSKSDGAKWGEKLSAWAGRHFDPNNIAMSREDWTTLCKIAATVTTFTGCLAAIVSCGTADSMTVGTLTIPCFWLTGVICGGHGSVTQGVLFDRCGVLMGAR